MNRELQPDVTSRFPSLPIENFPSPLDSRRRQRIIILNGALICRDESANPCLWITCGISFANRRNSLPQHGTGGRGVAHVPRIQSNTVQKPCWRNTPSIMSVRLSWSIRIFFDDFPDIINELRIFMQLDNFSRREWSLNRNLFRLLKDNNFNSLQYLFALDSSYIFAYYVHFCRFLTPYFSPTYTNVWSNNSVHPRCDKNDTRDKIWLFYIYRKIRQFQNILFRR